MVDRTHKLNLPQNVNAWDARVQLQKGGFNILAEYAQKHKTHRLQMVIFTVQET